MDDDHEKIIVLIIMGSLMFDLYQRSAIMDRAYWNMMLKCIDETKDYNVVSACCCY